MPLTWDNKKTENLLEAVLELKDVKEAKKFFRDLLTEDELEEFGNRFLAARMLESKNSYATIAGKTGLSPRTIARIAKWLNKGMGGYKLIINRFNKHHHTPLLAEKGLG